MIEQQQQTPHLSSHLQNAWPNPTHYPTPMHSSSSLSLKIEHRDPHHPRDPNIQAQLNLNRECFLGTWFYTPCDCLFPSLEQHVNGLVHVAVPNYYFHETNNKNLQQNAIWGSEIYTDDSDIIAMLLHSGHLQLPKKTAFPYDVLVILRVYPKLAYYPSTSFNGITSRAWTDHHGVSLLIESAEFIPPGSSVRKAGRKLRKKLLADRLKLYQYEVKRKKRLSHLDDATFVYDISGTKRLVYTPQLGPFLEHQSFVLEPKLNDQHRTFSISPINSNDNTYTLTQEHHGQTWTIIKEFHWSHLTFHTQGVLITAPTSSFYSLPDPLPMSHGVLVPPPSPSPSSTTSTGLTTTTTASTVTTTTTTTTSETMTPTLSSGSFPSSSLSLASGLRDAKKTIVIHVAWVWLASTFRNTS